MRTRLANGNGFTIIELMVALGLLVIVIAMGMSGWIFVIRGERRTSTQCELDIEVRTAIERLRSELRLSDVDQMAYYPPGPGPYTAISFPLAQDQNGDGLVDMQENGEDIDWTRTVIYHIARGAPDRLLRTEFLPRDNTLSHVERMEQLESVVENGDADGAANGENASTREIFSNFFEWSIEPKNSTLDSYNPTVARRTVLFGTALVGPGDHTYRFSVVDKNPASTGYKLGLDTLLVSPTTLACEAEDQTIVEGDASAERQPMEGSWSGNHHLLFDTGTADGELPLSLAIPCDRWEERNFRSSSSLHQRTQVIYDAAAGKYALVLVGKGEAWNAVDQTGTTAPTDTSPDLQGCAVRVLVRGDSATSGGYIRHSGRITGNSATWAADRPAVFLKIPADVAFHPSAVISVANPAGAATLDTVAGSARTLHLMRSPTDPSEVVGIVGTGAATQPVAIHTTNSYVVTYLLATAATPVVLPVWADIRATNSVSTVVLPAATATDLSSPSWSASAGLVKRAASYGLSRIVTAYPEDGYFTSQIADSTIEGNAYEQLALDEAGETGTGVGVRIRAGEAANLSGASAWPGLALLGDGDNLGSVADGRYVQFQAKLTSDALGAYTPKVSCVAISWAGETRLVDIGGVITVGPDHGVFDVRVDGTPLIKGLRVSLSIFKAVRGTPPRLTSSMSMEVEPRNTGK